MIVNAFLNSLLNSRRMKKTLNLRKRYPLIELKLAQGHKVGSRVDGEAGEGPVIHDIPVP